MSKNTNLYLSEDTKQKALEIAEVMGLLDQRKHPSMSQAVTAAIEALHEQLKRSNSDGQVRSNNSLSER
jgi:hypothetical protein